MQIIKKAFYLFIHQKIEQQPQRQQVQWQQRHLSSCYGYFS